MGFQNLSKAEMLAAAKLGGQISGKKRWKKTFAKYKALKDVYGFDYAVTMARREGYLAGYQTGKRRAYRRMRYGNI